MREFLATASASALLLLVACSSGARPPDALVAARAEFEELKLDWHGEIERFGLGSSSNTYDYWETPSAQGILRMGKRALPFVMEEIARGNFFFNVAAERISGTSIGEGVISEQERAKLWTAWWESRRNDPEWNPCAQR